MALGQSLRVSHAIVKLTGALTVLGDKGSKMHDPRLEEKPLFAMVGSSCQGASLCLVVYTTKGMAPFIVSFVLGSLMDVIEDYHAEVGFSFSWVA